MKVVIVGAGISGLTAAAVLYKMGHEVVIFETRDKIGGNCTDRRLADGTRLHVYGPHIFHTNNTRVWDFLHRFTNFNNYEHKVIANTSKGYIPIPFNDVSADKVGDLSPDEIRDLIFVDYSAKMWGSEWEYLPEEITKRVPQRRQGSDCRYFTDDYQGIPANGYNPMFHAMSHGCTIHYSSSPQAWQQECADITIYTGPLDAYFAFSHGRLPYKTLDINIRKPYPNEYFPAAVINHCDSSRHTRKAAHAWWHGDKATAGMVTEEHPRDCLPGDIPYYPIPYGESQELAKTYLGLEKGTDTVFLGRLATYEYLNMDQAVLQALEATDQFA